MYSFVFLCFIFGISLTSGQLCPFPSCSSNYDRIIGCTINCDSTQFPSRGQNFSSDTIIDLNLKNLENIPKNAFEGLLIGTLEIDSANLKSVDNEAFSNIKKLDYFYLTNLADLSLIFQNDKIKHLSEKTKILSVVNSNLDDRNVLVLLDSIKNWTKIESLVLDKNLLKNFTYDFNSFFPSLLSLSLSGNSIKFFDIKSSNLTSLRINNNQIENLEARAFKNLPSLRKLRLDSNKISKIYNDTFSSAKQIFELNLENNTINYIESNSFCSLNNMSRLFLSNNNLGAVRLYCLEKVLFLFLSNVQFEGEIDQNRIGSPKRVFKLLLSGNKISKISFFNMTVLKYLDLSSNNLNYLTIETIQTFPNLVELNIANNKLDNKILENLNFLKLLRNLYLSNNNISEINVNHLKELKELEVLTLDHNQIENVEFSLLESLESLNLRNNKLRQIKEESFSKLKRLSILYLDSNLISKISAKSFEFNSLRELDLSHNQLTTIPHLLDLPFLQSLNLKNNQIKFLSNYAFQRNEFSLLSIDLTSNNITSYSSKAFCSQYDTGLGRYGIELILDDINQMDKCFLRQFSSAKSKIISTVKPSCEHLFMAELKNIELNADMSQCQNTSNKFVTECLTNTKYKCPPIYDTARYTTWITGDPHLYSYKNRYELCSTGQDAICFQYGDFQLLCSDSYAGGSNKQATVLTGVKFIYQLKNSQFKVSFVANNSTFPDFFDNGQKAIYDSNNNQKLAEITTKDTNTRIISIARASTHIFISKWSSFYSITLRTTHDTYSKSSGYLFEGCRLQNQLATRKKRETINRISAECSAECSAIEFSAEDENFPKDLIHDLCLFDCNQIGKNSTAMIKSMVGNIKSYLLTDPVDQIDTTKAILSTSSISKLSATTTTKKNKASTRLISNLNKFVLFAMILKAIFKF